MDKTCAVCGKTLSWLNRPYGNSRWLEKHPEWKDKKICFGCLTEINKKERGRERKCANCAFHKVNERVEAMGSEAWSMPILLCIKFSMEVKGKEAERCTSFVPLVDYREKALKGEINNEPQNVQIIVDFSSLKDEMAKGGVVMTTYKCPNCNGTVDIPETGKTLICKFCGTPIKAVDIFDRIKSLIE